jgi:glutamate synthase (NADPH/NADH) large chain
VATQDPVLRARFSGKPEHVINFFFFVAEELRAIMADLGFKTVDEMIGRVDCIRPRSVTSTFAPKMRKLDFSELLYRPREALTQPVRCVEEQDHNLRTVLDHKLIELSQAAINEGKKVQIKIAVRNRDRAFGTMLSGRVALKYGDTGLPQDTITIHAEGSVGQSLGAFLAPGITIELLGDANDYAGKGLSGGIVAVRPPPGSPFEADEQVIVGNTVLYGATRGKAFFCGRGGERFCVRNSGVTAVVEGVGDHGCEYMTGGVVVCLGTTGRNFAAGMSGGIAYVFDEDGAFTTRCNKDMVALEILEGTEAETVRAIVLEHYERTKSAKAKALLANWTDTLARFVKVMPNEYKRILDDKRHPETAGIPFSTEPPAPAPRPYVPSGAWNREENIQQRRVVDHG